jgi:plasmid stabilization system protein ParE
MSTLAIQDIENIWIYWMQKSSLKQADLYYKDLIHIIKKIQIDFTIGFSIESIREEYRMILHQKYAIYYIVNENSTIDIIRILPQKLNPYLQGKRMNTF